jgi:hypothetical protein
VSGGENLDTDRRMTDAREKRIVRMCGAAALAVTLVYTIAGAIIRPAMFSDSAWGFLGWDRGTGLPFNYAASINLANIATDTVTFSSWWSPGQHLVPGLLELAGLPLGLAIIVVVALSSLLGLAGWYTLYRSFGFPAASSAIAVAIIAFARHFALPFGIYNGGEILVFGVAPWFLLAVWRLRRLGWSAILPLIVGLAAMMFAKLSGLLIAVSAIGAAVLAPVGPWLSRDRIQRAVVATVALGLFGVIFYIGWFTRGGTPVSSGEPAWPWQYVAGYAAYVTSAAVGAAFSFGDLAAFLFLNPDRRVFASAFPMYWLMLPAALAVAAFTAARLREKHAEYLRFVLFLWLALAVFLVAATARGSDLGVEDRHLRIVSLALLVGIVQAARSTPNRWLRATFAAVVLVSSLYGIASAVEHAHTNLGRPLGSRGFRHQTADAAVLAYIRSIDDATTDRRSTLIFVTSPEIALEVHNARVMGNHADFDTAEKLRNRLNHGQVPRLYVLVPQSLIGNGKAEAILRSLVDYPYDKWKATPVGSFVSFVQTR